MKTSPTLQQPEPGAAPQYQYSTAPAAFADLEWQRAQQRLLLYLQRLNVPAQKSAELCLEALRQAGSLEKPMREGHPVTAAMHALQALLADHQLGVSGIWTGLPTGDGKSIKPMPTLNRGSMAPRVLDLRPWLTPFVRLLRRLRGALPAGRAAKLIGFLQVAQLMLRYHCSLLA